jgi:hypothetical protein
MANSALKPSGGSDGFMIFTLEFLPTQHNVVKYWDGVFSPFG